MSNMKDVLATKLVNFEHEISTLKLGFGRPLMLYGVVMSVLDPEWFKCTTLYIFDISSFYL